MQQPTLTARIPQPVLGLIDEWAAYIANRRSERPSRATAVEMAFRNLKLPADAPASLLKAKAAYDATREIPA